MATSLDPHEAKRLDRRRRVLLSLPPDFLTINSRSTTTDGNLTQQQIQEQLDEQAALALHQQLNASAVPRQGILPPTNIRGRMLISVMQAKLVKNYGMTRMDPYVRIHIGHHIYETPTDVNGSKTPKWNKTIQCFLPTGINHVYLEIYDECNFSVDEMIAHANIAIPDEIFKGETSEEWYPLSGKQGDGKEGQIHLVFSFMTAPVGTAAPFVGAPGKHPPPAVHVSGQPQAIVPPAEPRPTFSEEDFKQLKELFPQMDEEVVKSVYEAGGFNKDSAANALLGMSD